MARDADSSADGRPYGDTAADHVQRRRQRAALVLGLVAAAIVLWFGVSAAIFDEVETLPPSTFGTQECFQPVVGGVQTGEVTISTAGDTDVTITAVDPTRSFVLSTQRSGNDGDPPDQSVAVQLTSPTNLRFTRTTTATTTPLTVRWHVVEYDCGVSVQRGVVTSPPSSPVTISEVDPARSFVLTSSSLEDGSSGLGADDLYAAWIQAPTELAISGGDSGPTTLAYQVVEFQPGGATVQQLDVDLTGLTTSTGTLATPVDPDRTFVLAGWSTTYLGPGLAPADIGVRTRLVDPTNVEVSRVGTGADLRVRVQVVELGDGTVVRHGIADLAPGDSTASATFDPVTVARSTMIATGQAIAGQSLGRGEWSTNDRTGDVSFTMALDSPTTATLTRSVTNDDASVAWQVIEWGGPPWWNTDWGFRQRIDVDAAVVAEQGYSVPVTLDHATMVADGFADASGDDVRVLRWDGTTWTELHRVLDESSSWNDAGTTIWFGTTDDIAAGTTATYWLYTGNGAVPVPPADPAQVFLLVEGFEDGTLGDLLDRTPGAWYEADPWTRRLPLTVSAASVSSDLTDFPLVVQLAEAELAAQAQADGSDIRFLAADGITPLDHEIERWDPGTGELTAWVRIPTLSSTTDTTIYLAWGAPNAPDQSDVAAVWGNQPLAVWHLAEDPSGALPHADDAGPDDREAVSQGAMTSADLESAVAGDGIVFDGSDDRLTTPAFAIPAGELTVSAWVRPDSLAVDGTLVEKGGALELSLVPGGATGRQVEAEVRVGGSLLTLTGGPVSLGTWHHVVTSYDGTTVTLFVDGVSVGSVAASGSVDASASAAIVLGDRSSGGNALLGALDEVRLVAAARSSDWIAAEYANQSSPGAFVSAGTVETGTWLAQGVWSHRLPLVLDAGLFTTTVADVVVPVRFKNNADLAGLALADGADLVVTAGDATTRLDHRLERFDAATGELVLWVRVPEVEAGVDERLFLYFGNASAVDQQDPLGVFGASFETVWQLDRVG